MTQRSYSEITTLFADNLSGAISEGDLRDFVDSVYPPYGSLNMVTPAATTIAITGNYYQINGVTAALNSHLMTPDTAGRITYNGASPRHFHLVASISMTCSGNNQIVGFKIAKNGTPIDASLLRRKIGTGSDIGSTALHIDVMLDTDDYIELFVSNLTSTATVTVEDLYMFAMGMFM